MNIETRKPRLLNGRTWKLNQDNKGSYNKRHRLRHNVTSSITSYPTKLMRRLLTFLMTDCYPSPITLLRLCKDKTLNNNNPMQVATHKTTRLTHKVYKTPFQSNKLILIDAKREELRQNRKKGEEDEVKNTD